MTADPALVVLSAGSVRPRYSTEESVRAIEELGSVPRDLVRSAAAVRAAGDADG